VLRVSSPFDVGFHALTYPKNAADGFNNTLRLLAGVANRYVSSTYPFRFLVDEFHTPRPCTVADALALGAITAIENWYVLPSLHMCLLLNPQKKMGSGGPQIAFRGGRIDAAEPNKPGVPQPQQDLKTHVSAFARQGFTQTEMIGLVACGCVLSPSC
jgi:hypothetical protein